MRRNDIDVYKGILVWLVVISHIMAVSVILSNTIFFRIIVNFHIPLFLGVSGYLFNSEKIKVSKWFHRLIFPWCVANLVYYILSGKPVSVRGLMFGVETHLWYIPSLIVFMTLVYLIEKLRFKKVSYAVLVVVAFTLQFPEVTVGESFTVKIMRFLVSNFRLQFLIFFLMGNMLRKMSIRKSCKKVVTIAGGMIFLLVAVATKDTLSIVFKFAGNIILMIGLLQSEVTISGKSRLINFLKVSGKNSMFIYLWHVIPLMLPVAVPLKVALMIAWGGIMTIVLYKKDESSLWYLVGLS